MRKLIFRMWTFLFLFSLTINSFLGGIGLFKDDSLRRIKNITSSPGRYIAIIDTILEKEKLSEKDKEILNLARNLLNIPDLSINFRGLQYLLEIPYHILIKYNLREQIINEALEYDQPDITSSDYAVVELLGAIPFLENLNEKDRVYSKLFRYIKCGDGNLSPLAMEAMITRLSRDLGTILTPQQVALHIEQIFRERSLNVWTIAEMNPEKFRQLMKLELTNKQIKALDKGIRHLLKIHKLDYILEEKQRELHPYDVKIFKNLLLNALALGKLSPKEAADLIYPLYDINRKFVAKVLGKEWEIINSVENNTAVLAALASLERELDEFITNGLSKVRMDSELRGAIAFLGVEPVFIKGVLTDLVKHPYVEIMQPAVEGLVKLGETEGMFEILKNLSLIGLPPLPGLKAQQNNLENLQDLGNFARFPSEIKRVGIPSPDFYYGVFNGLIELAKAKKDIEGLKEWFNYFVSDFYSEFQTAIEREKDLSKWRVFLTHDMPLFIEMSARGLKELISP